jgi:hypothetical protein
VLKQPEMSPSHPIWMGRRGWVVEVVETVAKSRKLLVLKKAVRNSKNSPQPPVLSARRCFVPPGAKKQVYDVLFVLLTVMVMCRKRVDIKCTEANLFRWEELRSDEVVATS